LDYDDYWMTIIDLRNKTAHIYNLEMAEEIYTQLPDVLERFKNLAGHIKSRIGE